MKLVIAALCALVLTACGGGGEPEEYPAPCNLDDPACVPPVPLPCTYPCTR